MEPFLGLPVSRNAVKDGYGKDFIDSSFGSFLMLFVIEKDNPLGKELTLVNYSLMKINSLS